MDKAKLPVFDNKIALAFYTLDNKLIGFRADTFGQILSIPKVYSHTPNQVKFLIKQCDKIAKQIDDLTIDTESLGGIMVKHFRKKLSGGFIAKVLPCISILRGEYMGEKYRDKMNEWLNNLPHPIIEHEYKVKI